MWKSILEYIERLLVAALAAFTTLGMFLIGNMIVKAIVDRELNNTEMIIIVLVCIIVTYLSINLLEEIHISLIELDAEDAEKKEEMKALYKEHINLDDIEGGVENEREEI